MKIVQIDSLENNNGDWCREKFLELLDRKKMDISFEYIKKENQK